MVAPKDFTLPAISNWSQQSYYASPPGAYAGQNTANSGYTAIVVAQAPRSPSSQHVVGNFSTILGNTFGWRIFYSNAWFAEVGDGGAGVVLNGANFGGSSVKWSMVALSVQQQTASLFVNGSLVASMNTANPGFVPNPTGVCSMGYDVNGAKDQASSIMGISTFGYVPVFGFPDDVVASSFERIYEANGQGLTDVTPHGLGITLFRSRYDNDGDHPPLSPAPMAAKPVWSPYFSDPSAATFTRTGNLIARAFGLPWA